MTNDAIRQDYDVIYNEDCIETLRRMPNDFLDLVVTSPPYDDMREYKGYTFDFKNTAIELYRKVKQGGVIVWIISDQTKNGGESGNSFRQAIYFQEVGFKIFDTMIYLKSPRGAAGNNHGYWQAFEYMFILSKGTPKTINLLMDRKNKESRNGDNGTKRLKDGTLMNVSRKGYSETGRRTNVWHYNVGNGHSSNDKTAFEHPAIFPEQLALDHIMSWSNESDLVYDPFMGSGTSAKMAILNNRHYIGSEISKEYCDLAEKRLKPYKEQTRLGMK